MKQLYCTNCGSPIPDAHSFCTNCGTKILSKEAADALNAREKSKSENANERDRQEAREKLLRSLMQAAETDERTPTPKNPAAEIRIITKEIIPAKETEELPINPSLADNAPPSEPGELLFECDDGHTVIVKSKPKTFRKIADVFRLIIILCVICFFVFAILRGTGVIKSFTPKAFEKAEVGALIYVLLLICFIAFLIVYRQQAVEEAPELSSPENAQDEKTDDDKPKAKMSKGRKILLAFLIPLDIILLTVAFLIYTNNMPDIGSYFKYRRAENLMDEGEYEKAISLLSELNDYKDSASMIPETKYHLASFLMSEGRYEEAYSAFNSISYKDSIDKAFECLKQNLSGIKNGDTVRFGSYEQDNDTTNGKEEIEWIVLNVEGSKALVISKYALACQPYNASYTYETWEKCTLRKWLNDSFLNTAFGSKYQELIPFVSVSADKNPKYSTNPGNATTDKVFLLSITEEEKYLTTDESRKCAPTAYAKAQGTWTSSSFYTDSNETTCWWWLRSPGTDQDRAAFVYDDGSVCYIGCYVDNIDAAVRPALWINLDS